ncbi:glycosyltransferase [Cellulomonas endophytica]|uniref:glycosyltransferase n=1 Tax=Cellulomonas endophytica TaxID=2494735 RepID=UPI001010BDE9|nr:glycosyltransferase [Cellulomonas endophytica]
MRPADPVDAPGPGSPPPLTIALGIITCGRPHGLERLLRAVAALDVTGLDVDVRVVVVDNDAVGAQGRAVAERLRPGLPFPLVVDVEAERGIPLARNRVVELAGDVEVLGWLDDDEAPRPDWLRRLVDELRLTGADVVIGPSVPHLPVGSPAWMADGGFFERTRFPTGTKLPGHHVRTCGVLVRRAAMPPRPRPFDESLRHTGGSDRELFVEMERSGAVMLWVDEAVMVEDVPASRARLRWVLRRAYRIGTSRSTTLVRDGASARRRARRALGGVRKIAEGVAAVAGAGLHRSGAVAAVQGLRECWYGGGLVAGAVGLRYQEYRHLHGT